MPLDYFLEKYFLSGAATFTEEWTSLSGSTFRSLFSSSSTPACSSTLWSTSARPSKVNFYNFFTFVYSSGSGSSTRSEKRDKMLIYIRLFLGMGITWYFEIITFGLSSLEPDPRWLILTDTLNMCQVLLTSTAVMLHWEGRMKTGIKSPFNRSQYVPLQICL